MSLKQIWRLLKDAYKEWNEDKVSRLAAALAYYTIFSVAPLLIIVIAVAGAVFGEDAVRGELVRQIQGLVGRDGAEFIQEAIRNTNRQGAGTGTIASLIGLGVLLFGASGVFTQLQDALNTIWEVTPRPSAGIRNVIRSRFLSFAMVLAIAFLLLVSLVVSAGLAAVNSYASQLLPGADGVWQLVNFAVSLGIVTLLFAMIFKFLPDAEIAWSDVWIGAFITALLFNIGKTLLGLYLGNSSFGSTYGAAGSLVVIVAWIYYAAQILFFGAEFTQVYARKYGSRIVPANYAMDVPEDRRGQEGISHRETLKEHDRATQNRKE